MFLVFPIIKLALQILVLLSHNSPSFPRQIPWSSHEPHIIHECLATIWVLHTLLKSITFRQGNEFTTIDGELLAFSKPLPIFSGSPMADRTANGAIAGRQLAKQTRLVLVQADIGADRAEWECDRLLDCLDPAQSSFSRFFPLLVNGPGPRERLSGRETFFEPARQFFLVGCPKIAVISVCMALAAAINRSDSPAATASGTWTFRLDLAITDMSGLPRCRKNNAGKREHYKF
jgi:hypothetical protein